MSPGGKIVQYPWTGGTNQQWTLRRPSNVSTGWYEIASVNSLLVLDVQDAPTLEGAKIDQWSINGGNNQLWTIGRTSTSTGHEIFSANYPPPGGSGYSHQVLDEPNFLLVYGTQMEQWPLNGGTNQQWNFVNVSSSAPKISRVCSTQLP